MKALSASILAGQQALTQRPYVQSLTVTNRRRGVQPLVPEALYAEAATSAGFAACFAADGSLCRMRVAGGGDVYVQRVPSPATASTAAWGAWTLLAAGVASGFSPVAMVAGPVIVNMVYVKPDGYSLVRRFSGNNGASWSAESAVSSDAAAPVRAVAVATKPTVEDRLFVWGCGPNVAGAAVVELRSRTLSPSGVLGPLSVSTVPKFWQVEGLACSYGGDWHVAVAGQDGRGEHPWGVFLTLMGNGAAAPVGTWLPLGTLQRADAATEYRYDTPSLVSAAGAYRCAYQARRPDGPDRLEIAHRVVSGYGTEGWTAPAPFGVDVPGLLVASRTGEVLLAGERAAWSLDTTAQSLELADRLRSYRYRAPGGLSLVLSDADGASSTAQMQLLRPGAGLTLARGLSLADGPVAVALPEQEVILVRRVVEAGERALLVECRDAEQALAGFRASRSLVWAGGSRAAHQILADLCAAAGVPLVVVGIPSAQASRTPAFEVGPGESALAAVRRLLEMAPERLGPDGYGLTLVDPTGVNTPYGYGNDGHPLLHWELEQRPIEPNHVQAYGPRGEGIYGEALDAGEVARLGQRLTKLLDGSLSSAAEASGLAAAALAVAKRQALRGRFQSMPNLGLELWDRVEIRPAAAVAGEARTVTSYEERYCPATGEWTQAVTCGGA